MLRITSTLISSLVVFTVTLAGQQPGLITHHEVNVLHTQTYSITFSTSEVKLVGDPAKLKGAKLKGYEEDGDRVTRSKNFIGAQRQFFLKISPKHPKGIVPEVLDVDLYRRSICSSPAADTIKNILDRQASNGEFAMNLAFGGEGQVPDFAICYRIDVTIGGEPLSHYIDVYAAASGIDIYLVPKQVARQ